MQGKKNLGKAIALSLLLASVGFSTAGATINSGTHDIGGTYNVSSDEFVASTGVVTLNATSDVTGEMASSKIFIHTVSPDYAVTVNMNNHSLKTEGAGYLIYNDANNVPLSITNAYDISSTSTERITLSYQHGSGNTLNMQANHDITITNDVQNRSSIYAGTGNTLTFTAGNNFTSITQGNPLQSTGGTINVVAGNDVLLKATGVYSGIIAYIEKTAKLDVTAKNGKIDVISMSGNDGSVRAEAGGSVTLHAAKDINIGGNAKRGIRSSYGTIDITSDTGTINVTAINTTGAVNAAIYAGKTGTDLGKITINSDTVIDAVNNGVMSEGGTITLSKGLTSKIAHTAISASDGGVITLAKDVTVSGTAAAITAVSGGTVTATNAASDKKITGNITSDGSDSSVDVNFLTSNSNFTGATTATNNGAINLEFGNSAPWNVTGDSSLTNLVNNSTINMNYTGTKGETITTTKMSGTGNVNMNLDWNTNQGAKQATANSDYINVTGTGSGTQTVSFDRDAAHLLSMEGGDKLYFATVANGDLTFNSATSLVIPRTGKLYDYVYGLGSDADGAGKDWYIGLTGKQEGSTVGVIGDFTYDAYAMGTEMDRLNKRMGESRYLEEDGAGTWVRIKHGRWGDHDYSSKYTMFQLGYDNPYMAKDGAHRTGFAVDYTKNNVSIDNGDGDNSRYAVSLYDTWNGDKKHYRDLVFRVGRINNDYTAHNALGEEVNADFNNNFMSVSGEWGRRNDLRNNWYFEPQTQLQIARIDGADYTTSNGIKVSQNGDTSIIGRLGFRIGRELPKTKDNRISNVYFKADLLHEFKGSRGYTAYTGDGSESVDKDYAGHKTWMDVGVGADMSLGHNRHLWVDLERSFGSGLSATWQGNIGFRWDLDKRVKPVSTFVEAHPVEHVVPVKETYYDTVYFDFDEDQPKAVEQAKVAKFAETAKANPNVTYALVGNTDTVGTDTYNMDLSKRRVENVKSAAEKLGVPASRMQDSYLGKSHPAQSNDTAAGRAANRRVEIYEHKADTSTQN